MLDVRKVDADLATVLSRLYKGEGFVLGHGSFFSPNRQLAQDIDILNITPCKQDAFRKDRCKLGSTDLDVTTISMCNIVARFDAEAAGGYQFLSRSIATSTLLYGSVIAWEKLKVEAQARLTLGPQPLAFKSAAFHRSRLILTMKDIPRLSVMSRDISFIQSFEHLLRLGFYNRNDWYSPAAYVEHWSQQTIDFANQARTSLKRCLNGSDELYVAQVLVELQSWEFIKNMASP